MKLSVTTGGTTRYLFAKLGWKEQFDPKEIEMLSAGAVPMLIAPDAVQGRKNNVIQYNISPYSTLEFYLSCILSQDQFAQLLLQCIDLFRQMQRVYLNYRNLVLSLDQVYVLLADRTVHFIYLPLAKSAREASIPEFFRRMILRASRSTYEQVSFLEGCLAWLNRPAPFVMDEFEDFVRGVSPGQGRQAVPAAPALAGAVSAPVSAPAPVPAASQPARLYQPIPRPPESPAVQPGGVPLQDGGTVQLEQPASGGTVVLAAGPQVHRPRFYLLREKTGERVELSRFPFLVGVQAGGADYCVTGNPAISRKHAVFTYQDGQCFVTDQKSTNRTYVNDCALEPQAPQLLQNGDRIRLANEAFTFAWEE